MIERSDSNLEVEDAKYDWKSSMILVEAAIEVNLSRTTNALLVEQNKRLEGIEMMTTLLVYYSLMPLKPETIERRVIKERRRARQTKRERSLARVRKKSPSSPMLLMSLYLTTRQDRYDVIRNKFNGVDFDDLIFFFFFFSAFCQNIYIRSWIKERKRRRRNSSSSASGKKGKKDRA